MILTLTGAQPTVTITGLRDSSNNDLVISSANSPLNLLDFYDEEDIQVVLSVIQAEIAAGNLTAQTQEGDTIADVNEVFEDTSQLSADIDALEADQAAQDITIGVNQTNISNESTARQAADTNLQNQIDSLNTGGTSQQAEIDALETENAAQQAEIDALETEQTTQNTNISQNASDIASNDTDISNLQSANTTQQTEIDQNETDIANLETEQTTQNTNISQNAADISSNDTDIANIQTDQATQDTAIAANTSTNTAQQAEIDQAELDIDALETENTSQDAAISGKENALGNPTTNGQVLSSTTGGVRSWIDPPSSVNNLSDLGDADTAGGQTGDVLVRNSSGVYVSQAMNNGFTIFPIWAEENGGLSNNNTQWSYGNGATGIIGVPLGVECELFAVSFQADTVATSVSIDVFNGNTVVATPLFNGFSNESATVILPTPQQYNVNDLLRFRTNTEVGAFTDARVCAWFRVAAQANIAKTDRSRVSNAGVAFNSAAFATIPGMTTTVTLTQPGDVEGTLFYGGQRSGAANAVVDFRINIQGVTGGDLGETLSTFNDTGAVNFFRETLPAGTYTVSAEASTDQPINFNSVSLKAEANED